MDAPRHFFADGQGERLVRKSFYLKIFRIVIDKNGDFARYFAVIFEDKRGIHGEGGRGDGLLVRHIELQGRSCHADAGEIEKGGCNRFMAPSGRMETKGRYVVPAEGLAGYSDIIRSGKMEIPPTFPIDREVVVIIVSAFRFWIFRIEINGDALVVLFGGIQPEIEMRVA